MSEEKITSDDVSKSVDAELNSGAALASELFEVPDDVKLSKVLFPETHTNDIQFYDKKRELHVVPLKVSKKVFSLVKEHATNLHNAIKEPEAEENKNKEMGPDIAEALLKASKEIVKYYASKETGWQECVKALEDEDVSLGDMQSLCNAQQQLNGANDFFFGPLRTVIRVCQTQEVGTHAFQKMSSTLRLLSRGTAPLTNSSPSIPKDNSTS